MVISGEKRSMTNPLPDYEGDDAFKKGAKDLGTKVIDNHPQKTISKLKSWTNTAPSFSMSLPSEYKPYP